MHSPILTRQINLLVLLSYLHVLLFYRCSYLLVSEGVVLPCVLLNLLAYYQLFVVILVLFDLLLYLLDALIEPRVFFKDAQLKLFLALLGDYVDKIRCWKFVN